MRLVKLDCLLFPSSPKVYTSEDAISKKFKLVQKKMEVFKWSDVFVCSNVINKFKFADSTLNNFQKPITLLRNIIKSFGPKDIHQANIIDLFSGLCSVAIAAHTLKCKTVMSYESDLTQFNGSYKRFETYLE